MWAVQSEASLFITNKEKLFFKLNNKNFNQQISSVLNNAQLLSYDVISAMAMSYAKYFEDALMFGFLFFEITTQKSTHCKINTNILFYLKKLGRIICL